MSKHTPGPWRLDKHGIYIFGPDNEMIAMIRGAGENLPQAANGQLLAAAPDLLEACKEAIGAMPIFASPHELVKLQEIYDKLEAASAKAGEEGEG